MHKTLRDHSDLIRAVRVNLKSCYTVHIIDAFIASHRVAGQGDFSSRSIQ